jgi:hypothetical protein
MKREFASTLEDFANVALHSAAGPIVSLAVPQISLGADSIVAPKIGDTLQDSILQDNFDTGRGFVRTFSVAASFLPGVEGEMAWSKAAEAEGPARGPIGAGLRPSATVMEDIGVCGKDNCFNRALTLDLRLGGAQVSAVDGPAVTYEEAYNAVHEIYPNSSSIEVNSRAQMEKMFAHGGEGTRGIIIGWGREDGHAFNGVFSNGRLVLMDAGLRGRASLQGYTSYNILFTQWGGGF